VLFVVAEDSPPIETTEQAETPLLSPAPESVKQLLAEAERFGELSAVLSASAVYWGQARGLGSDRPPLDGHWVADRLRAAGLLTETHASDSPGGGPLGPVRVHTPAVWSSYSGRYLLGHSRVLVVVVSEQAELHENPDPATPAYVAVSPRNTAQGGAAIAKALCKVLGLGEESSTAAELSGPDHWIRAFPNLWYDNGTVDPPWELDSELGLGGTDKVRRPAGACLMKNPLGSTSERGFCPVCAAFLSELAGGSFTGTDQALTLTEVTADGEPAVETGPVTVEVGGLSLDLASNITITLKGFVPPETSDDSPSDYVNLSDRARAFLGTYGTALGKTWTLFLSVDPVVSAEFPALQLAFSVQFDGIGDGALSLSTPIWQSRTENNALAGPRRVIPESKGSQAGPEGQDTPLAGAKGIAYLFHAMHPVGGIGTQVGRLNGGSLTTPTQLSLTDQLEDPDELRDQLAWARCVGLSDSWPHYPERYLGGPALELSADKTAVRVRSWRTPAANPVALAFAWAYPGVPVHLDRLRSIKTGADRLPSYPGLSGGRIADAAEILARDRSFAAKIHAGERHDLDDPAAARAVILSLFAWYSVRRTASHDIADILLRYAKRGELDTLLTGLDISGKLLALHQSDSSTTNRRGIARCRAYLGNRASLQLRMLTRIPNHSAWIAGWAGRDRAVTQEAARLSAASLSSSASSYSAVLRALESSPSQRYALARNLIDRLRARSASLSVGNALHLSEAKEYVASFQDPLRKRIAAARAVVDTPADLIGDLDLSLSPVDVKDLLGHPDPYARASSALHTAIGAWAAYAPPNPVVQLLWGSDPNDIASDMSAVVDKLAALRKAGQTADAAQPVAPSGPVLPPHLDSALSANTLAIVQSQIADTHRKHTAAYILETLGYEATLLEVQKLVDTTTGSDFLAQWHQTSSAGQQAWLDAGHNPNGLTSGSASADTGVIGEALRQSATGSLVATVRLYLQVGQLDGENRADRALAIGLKLAKELTPSERSSVTSWSPPALAQRALEGANAHLSRDVLWSNIQRVVANRDLSALYRIAVSQRGWDKIIERPEVFGQYIAEVLESRPSARRELRAALVYRDADAVPAEPSAATAKLFRELVELVETSAATKYLEQERADELLGAIYGTPDDLSDFVERAFLQIRIENLTASRKNAGEFATDTFANTGTELDEVAARLELSLHQASVTAVDQTLQARILSDWNALHTALAAHVEKRAAVAWYANMAATTVAGILATAVTGGAGAGPAVAAIAAMAASGVTAVSTRSFIEGSEYLTLDEITEEAAAAAIDGVVGAGIAKAGPLTRALRRMPLTSKLQREAMENSDEFAKVYDELRALDSARPSSSVYRELAMNTLEGFVSSGVNTLVMTALDEATWDRQATASFYQLATATAQGAAMGALFGGATTAVTSLTRAIPGLRRAEAEGIAQDPVWRRAAEDLDPADQGDFLKMYRAMRSGDLETIEYTNWSSALNGSVKAHAKTQAEHNWALAKLRKMGVLDRMVNVGEGSLQLTYVEGSEVIVNGREGVKATTEITSTELPPPVPKFLVRIAEDAAITDLIEEIVHIHDLLFCSEAELGHVQAMAAYHQARWPNGNPPRSGLRLVEATPDLETRLAAHRARAAFEPKIAEHLENLDIDFAHKIYTASDEERPLWQSLEDAYIRAHDETRIQHNELLANAEEHLAKPDGDPDRVALLELLDADPSLTASSRTIVDMLKSNTRIQNHPKVVAAGGFAEFVRSEIRSVLTDSEKFAALGIDPPPSAYEVDFAVRDTAARIRRADGTVACVVAVIGNMPLTRAHGSMTPAAGDEGLPLQYRDLGRWEELRGSIEGPMLQQLEAQLKSSEKALDGTAEYFERMANTTIEYQLGTSALRLYGYARAAAKLYPGIKIPGDGRQLHHVLALWLGGRHHLDIPPLSGWSDNLSESLGLSPDELRNLVAGLLSVDVQTHRDIHRAERRLAIWVSTAGNNRTAVKLTPSSVRVAFGNQLGIAMVVTSPSGASNSIQLIEPGNR